MDKNIFNYINNIKNLSIPELEHVSEAIRRRILEIVSKNGGHLSSTLGATDLIVAMHHVFDSKKDPFIFDVSHQAYAHKLLTGRWNEFESLRQWGGLAGYTKPQESEHDYYVSGHSSTSISLAVGSAKAIRLKDEDGLRVPVALIGDGSMSAGMVYEALNELGDIKYPVIIILNDNEMSISKPIGAISRILSRALASRFYQKIKRKTEDFLTHLPDSATYLAKRLEESFRLITPGLMFEEMGIDYIGPIDGHDLASIIENLQLAKSLARPVVIHAQTLKGKGYGYSEGYLEHWHGVPPFDINTGQIIKKSGKKSATDIFADELLKLAKERKDIVGVTAAMPSGTGLSKLIDEFPDRFWDVAIAEQHAVTSMGSLAKEGFKPFCVIYSTFLQRAYDQIIHDICLMNLPVVFAIDRGGIVGEDGETHQGVFDLSYLSPIPNMTIFAPRDEVSLRDAIQFSADFPTPIAFRYPRGSFILDNLKHNFVNKKFELAKANFLKDSNSNVIFVGYGNGVGRAVQTANLLPEFDIAILDLRFLKPLDSEQLLNLSQKYKKWFIFSDSTKIGGVASNILEFFNKNDICIKLESFEYGDEFISHGKTQDVENNLGLSPEKLGIYIRSKIERI